MKFVLNIYPIS